MAKKKQEFSREQAQLELNSLDTNTQILGVQQEMAKALRAQEESISKIVIDEALRLAQAKKKEALTKDEAKAVTDVYIANKKYLEDQKTSLKIQKESVSTWKTIGGIINKIHGKVEGYVNGFLMPADKAIKSIALEFGQAGGRADEMRQSIEGSAVEAARLGLSTKDMVAMYKGYVDQVGRTVTLNREQMEAMADLAKGTGLATDGAAQLAGQFEMMGRDAVSVNEQVQGILETSERMGVNATKVLKAVSANFKNLQTYTFRTGVQGMGDMAAYAEKFKIDIDDALNAAEKSRRLDGAVELAAKLQVLGGEFAKSDPFEMLFLSRNDPKKFQQKIAELTKGMATLNKVGDDFEIQLASPMARDMLEQAGDALGISLDKMTEMAKQQFKMNSMRKDMMNSGYTKEQRDVIEGLAQMDSSTGKFFVNVKGMKRDIADLTTTELETLKKQDVSLKERAKNAQTFDDQWTIFMEEMKAVGLPLLQGINAVLNDHIRPLMDKFTKFLKEMGDGSDKWMKMFGKGAAFLMLGVGAAKILMGVFGKIGSVIGSLGGGSKVAAMASGGGKAATLGGGAGKGLSALGKGAGIGLAAVGMGAGLKLAGEGISSIADSLSKLDDKQMEYLKFILIGMPAAMAGLSVLASIPALQAGFMIATGAVIGFGLGTRMAGEGVLMMSEGLTKLIPVAAQGKGALLDLAGGILAIQGAMLAGGIATLATGGLAGLLGNSALGNTIETLTDNVGDLERVGSAFASISAVLKGSQEDYADVRETVNAIAAADFSNLTALGNLKNLFEKPLKVEFSDKEVNLVSNITLNIDGNRFIEEFNIVEKVILKTKNMQSGMNFV